MDGDFAAGVDCYAPDGTRQDASFVISVIHPTSISPSMPVPINEANLAYAWAGNPTTESYEASPFYAENPFGGVNITRSAVGTYAVRFERLAQPSPIGTATFGGTVQVTGYGSNSNKCSVLSWGGSPDFVANVACTDVGGNRVDSAFTIAVIPPIHTSSVAYAWANAPAGVNYHPNATYSYNPSGGEIVATRRNTGKYSVTFRSLNESGDAGGHVLATAYGNASYLCNVESWSSGGGIKDMTANIACFDSSGQPVDSQFTVLVVPEP